MQAFLDIFDIYLLEAVVNGILLGGVLALLALGLNLIFGVIDVTWICYAELVMIGMYGMYYMVQVFGLPYWVAAPFAILLVAALGAALHYIVIAPLYGHRDPRHLAGPPDYAADGRRHQAHLPHHLGARRRARRPRCLPAGAAIRRASVRRTVVRADHLPDLRARRARQFRRRLHR